MRLQRCVPVLAAAATTVAALLPAVPAAHASGLSTETIAMTWLRSGTGPTPPFTGTGAGTFTATGPVTDAGTLTLNGQDVGVSSPVSAAAWTDRTLASPNGTLHLRCFERSTDFSNLAAIPFTGSCTITGGTGTYAGIHGHGDFSQAIEDADTGIGSEILVLNLT
jgi:hypothetical protein